MSGNSTPLPNDIDIDPVPSTTPAIYAEQKKAEVHEIYRAVLPLTADWWKVLPGSGPFQSSNSPHDATKSGGESRQNGRMIEDYEEQNREQDGADERALWADIDAHENLSNSLKPRVVSTPYSHKIFGQLEDEDDVDFRENGDQRLAEFLQSGAPSPPRRSHTSLSLFSEKSSKKVSFIHKAPPSGSIRRRPDDLETLLDITDTPVEYDKSGARAYQKACRKYGAPISAKYGQKLRDEETLDMSNYGLGSEGVKAAAIPLMINTNCTVLNLSGNKMNQKALSYLTIILEENTSIKALNLSSTDIGRFGGSLIAELINLNDVLRKLDISGNGFNDDDGILIAAAIQNDRNLLEVNLSGNNLGTRCCEALSKMIAENTNLESLDLSWNHLRQRGAVLVAAGLKENVGLKRVNLAWNGFEDEGAAAMASALVANGTLVEIDLLCNRITGRGLLDLVKALGSNDTLTVLLLGRNHISESSAHEALSLLGETDDLHLEHLDLSEILFSKRFADTVEHTKTLHERFRCTWGYTDSYGKRKLQKYDAVDEAFKFMQDYITEHNINLAELFAKFDADGSMSVTYDEFREGLKDAGIPMTPLQVDQLIKFLDQDGDGEIDFSELVIGADIHEKQKQVEKDINEKLQSQK